MNQNRALRDYLSHKSLWISFKKWQKLIISESRQKTAKIIFYTLSSKMFAHGLAICASILIARQLGPEGKGILAAIIVIPTFISSFGHLGLAVSNIYYTGKKRNNAQLYANSILFLCLASLVYYISCLFFLPFLNKSYFSGLSSSNIGIIALILIPLLLAKHFFIDFLRGLEKYSEYNYSNIIQHSSKLFLILALFFANILTVQFVLLATMAALFFANLYCVSIIKKHISFSIRNRSWSQFKESLSFGLREYLGNLFATLNVKIDLLILAAFMDKALIGIYSVAIAISEVFQYVPNSISVVLLPKISKSPADKGQKILRKSIIANTVVLSFGWFLFILAGWWIIPFLYGEQFKEVYYLAVIIIFGTIFLSVAQIINKYFSGVGKPEIKSLIRAINIPIKAILMYFLIKYYGLEGAAWSFALTTFSLLLITCFFYFVVKNKITTT